MTMNNFHNNPWLGLSSYKYEDSSRFYGRDEELQTLTDIIRQNIFTTLYGVSGAGKTSLINAGLSPILEKEQYLPIYVRLSHGADSLPYEEQLISAVESALEKIGGESEQIENLDFDCKSDRLWLYFHSHHFWSAQNHKVIPLLFIDQFEEIFTKNDDSAVIWSFFYAVDSLQYNYPPEKVTEQITSLNQRITFSEDMNFRMVLSMREDFLPRLEDYTYDIPALRRNRVGIKPLNGLQALEVIMKPCPELITREVALHIISKIVGKEQKDDVKRLKSTSVETSILSLFCTELYNYRHTDKDVGSISKSLVDKYGENILELYYSRNMQLLPLKTQICLESQLLTRSGFRNSVALEDLIGNDITQEQLELLEENRIIRIEEVNHVSRVEFTHDVLCQIAKAHREKRREKNEFKKRQRASWQMGIETFILSIISIFFVLRVYTENSDYQLGRMVFGVLFALSSIFFVFSKWIHLFNDHKQSTFYKLLLYSTIVLTSFQRKDALFGINLYIIFICLFSLYYLSSFIKTKYSRVRGFIFHIVLSLFLLATNIATNSGEMFFAWTLVSFFVIFPYRFLRENNILRLTMFSLAIESILYIPFIVFVFIPLLHPESQKIISFFSGAVYLWFFYTDLGYYDNRKKRERSFKEALRICVSLSLYKEFPFLKTFASLYICLIALLSTIITGLALNDVYSSINIIVCSLFFFFLLKDRLKLNHIGFKPQLKKWNTGFVEFAVMAILLLLIICLQYIPYGAIGQIICTSIAFYIIWKKYKFNAEGSILKSCISKAILWGIPFVFVPLVSFGYNPLSLIQYGRVFHGKIHTYNKPYTRFVLIHDFNGNRGLRDRSNLVIPVQYKDVSAKCFDAQYFGQEFPLSIEAGITGYSISYDSLYYFYGFEESCPRRLTDIVFRVKNTDGTTREWECSKHLDMDNVCTKYITSTYKELLKYGCAFYMNYLISCHPEEKELIRKSVKTLINSSLQKTLPTSAIRAFFINVHYLKNYNISEDGYGDSIFNKLLPNQIKKLDSNYNKDRLLIECAFYQLLFNDVKGAQAKLKDLIHSSDEQTKISANRVLCDLYIVTKKYKQAEQLINQFKDEEEWYFDNQKTVFTYYSHSFDGKIRFVDAIRNDLVKLHEYGVNIDTISDGYKRIKSYLPSYSVVPEYDYSVSYFDIKGNNIIAKNNSRDYKLHIKCQKQTYFPSYNGGIEYKYMYIMCNDKRVTPLFLRFSSPKNADTDIITIVDAKSHKRRFFNLENCQMLEGEYDKAWRFSEGYAFVVKDKKLFVIDKNGNRVSTKTIPYQENNNFDLITEKCRYKYAKEPDFILQHGTCEIQNKDGKVGLIDKQGNWVVSPMYKSISKDVGEGYRIVSKKSETTPGSFTEAGVIDKDGNLIIKMEHRITVPIYYYLTSGFNSEKFEFDNIVFDLGYGGNQSDFIAHLKAESKNIGHSTKISKSK